MESLPRRSENFQKKGGGSRPSVVKTESFTDSNTEPRRTSSCVSSSSDLTELAKAKGPSSPCPLNWPIQKVTISKCGKFDEKENEHYSESIDTKFTRISSKLSEIDMMKERFAKLLLGEDMSGSGEGVCTALAISNAITNLCASVFGQLWRLEPLPSERKGMWQKEMEWLLCVSDHIVELIPSWQTLPDGSKFEVMTCRPRSDIFINLPALRKLDNMLLEILDSFTNAEFWYVDQGFLASDSDGSVSFRKTIQRQEEKWWLPVPRVPTSGLSENSRRQLNHTRECAHQILKAAMTINTNALAEMEVPESYLESLPKNGRSCLGDVLYRYITSDQFTSECLLDCIDLSSKHVASELADRVEASIHVWRRRANSRPQRNPNRPSTKSSWEMVKDFIADADKREFLAEKAEGILLSLKQRIPGLAQTSLDSSKIQCNKDIGKSILESYSRVLESMAFNIVARIDDLLYVDDLTKHSDRFSVVPAVSVIDQRKVSKPTSAPVSGTPRLTGPASGERTPFLIDNNNNIIKHHRRGFGVKRVLSNYLGGDAKAKVCSNSNEVNCSNQSTNKTEQQQQQKELFCTEKNRIPVK